MRADIHAGRAGLPHELVGGGHRPSGKIERLTLVEGVCSQSSGPPNDARRMSTIALPVAAANS